MFNFLREIFKKPPEIEISDEFSNLSNREFLEKALKYREECIKTSGFDPFLPNPLVTPYVTDTEVKAAQTAAEAIQTTLEQTK